MNYFRLLFFIAIASVFLSCSKNPEIKTMKSGLKYLDETIGKGRIAKDGDLIAINFRGWIIKDTTDLFSDWTADSTMLHNLIADSYRSGRSFKFVLGEGAFIKGTEEGIVGMQPNGMRTLIIPSELAYGNQGAGPIPPNSDLKFTIELLEVKDPVVAKMWDVDTTKIVTTESGLKYEILKEGEGVYATSGNVVTVHYTGFLPDGTKFDSSVERDEPFSFVLGNNQVIKGWEEGIKLLKKGSKARFIIPPFLGYGSAKVGSIPPNSTLVFDVALLDIK